MTTPAPTVGAYRTALLEYLLRNDEAALTDAYDLGRSGLEAGYGLLQIVNVHDRALRVILEATPLDDESRRRINAASAQFLLEAISPFGMAADGYRHVVKSR